MPEVPRLCYAGPMGRRTVFTVELGAHLCEHIAAGAPIESAARMCGINASTAHTWVAKGDGGDETYADFADQFHRARERKLQCWRDQILDHGEKDWRALAWVLARMDPDRHSEKRTLAISGDLQGLSPQELRERLTALLSQLPDPADGG